MKPLTWVLSIISVLGVGGTIVAFVVAPVAAGAFLRGTVSTLLKCRPCLIAIAFFAVAIGSWWFGHHQAVLECREDALQSELRAKEADLNHAEQAKNDATERAKTIEATADERHQNDLAYINDLESRPGCALDDGDIDGMRARPRAARPKSTAGSR